MDKNFDPYGYVEQVGTDLETRTETPILPKSSFS